MKHPTTAARRAVCVCVCSTGAFLGSQQRAQTLNIFVELFHIASSALPNHGDLPTLFAKSRAIAPIALHVAQQLWLPVFGIGLWF